ncbi:MAG: MFS transporter [Sulfobacillus thermotolerans]|nr:MFS transporter [Sulfobacillus thermotolerans]
MIRTWKGPPGFGRFGWAAVQIGLSGWMVQVGLFVMLVMLHSAAVMAAVILVATLPSLLLAPVVGAWLDRHDVPGLAATASVGQALLLPFIGILLTHHIIMMTGLYALYNVLGSAGTTGRQQLRYRVTPPAQWADVNARLGSITGMTTIVGALLGGTVALWGLMTLLILAAILRLLSGGLLASLVLLARARPVEYPPEPHQSFGRTVHSGFRALRDFPAASSVLIVGIAWGLIGGSYDVLLTDYGVRILHGGGWGVSSLYITDGAGVLLGTLVARWICPRWRPHAYGLAYLLQGLFWTLFAVSHTWNIALPWLLVMRMASGLIIAWDTTLLLETVPPQLHSRVYSLHNATYGTVGKLSLALTALFMAWVGPEGIAVIAGVGSMLVGTTWWVVVGRRWPPSGVTTTEASQIPPQNPSDAHNPSSPHAANLYPPSSHASQSARLWVDCGRSTGCSAGGGFRVRGLLAVAPL